MISLSIIILLFQISDLTTTPSGADWRVGGMVMNRLLGLEELDVVYR